MEKKIEAVVKKYHADPYGFVEEAHVDLLVQLAKHASDRYYNGKAIMADAEFDLIVDAIRSKDPENAFLGDVGAPIMSKNKVTLPFYMGSMDKIKPDDDNELQKWSKKYDLPYVISDKLDGVSAMLEIDNKKAKLYTRGNGEIGTDITPLIKHLDLANIIKKIKGEYVVIRGELIMSKVNFGKYEDKMANARNMVSGIVNAKKIIKERVEDVDFVAYEIIEPWMPYDEQYIALKKNGFKVADNEAYKKELTMTDLQTVLRKRKQRSEYEIDGIIVTYNDPKKRQEEGNPDYAFAFKETVEDQTAEVQVLEVEWNESKDGYLKPRLRLQPTKLSGVTITYVTAFNAKYVKDNGIGKGAVIKLVRSGDVIPHIVAVIKKAKSPDMPGGEYEWTKSGVDIYLSTKTHAGLVQELNYFFKKLSINNLSVGITKKLVENGIDSIIKIINVTKGELAKIDGFKDKMVNKLYDNIQAGINDMTLLDFMNASNIFGHGIGERKLKKILQAYPDIMAEEEVFDAVVGLDGFDTITATQFAESLPNFIQLFAQLPEALQERLLEPPNKKTGKKFKDMRIVFSGFRNKDWEETIEDNGGNVTSTVSKNTTILVAKAEDIESGTNAKIKKALELGVEVMTLESFAKRFKL
jgi:NAD-dependent DNA ligase